MSYFFTIIFLLFFCQQSWALSLMAAYDLAVQKDPTFQSAAKDYEAGLKNRSLGLSAVLPKVSANYSNQANRLTQTNQPPLNHYGSNYSAIQLTQPILNLEAIARFRQGRAQADFAESKFTYLKYDLFSRVLQSYTDVLLALDQLAFQEAELIAYEEQFRVSERQYQKGELTITDLLQTKSGALVAKAKYLESKDDLENARRKFEGLIGQPVKLIDLYKLQNKLPMILVDDKNFDQWELLALQSNTELIAMQNQIDIAYQEYKKNIAGHFPVVNFVAASSNQANNSVTTLNMKYSQSYVGVQINIPIYSGGETNARSSQAYALYEKSLADYGVAKERVVTELRKQYDALRTGRQKIQALSEARDSLVRLVDAMRKNVKGGERIHADVLVADKSLKGANKDLSQAKYQYLMAYLKLYQAGGIFEYADFQKISTYFER